MRTPFCIALSVLVLLAGGSGLSAQIAEAPRLERIVAPALEQQWLVAAALGQITPEGESVQGFGRFGEGDERVPDGDTLFEIGSISKVFTGLLLADAVVRGELSLDTTLAELLPEGVELQVVGRPITLLDLTTHTSGLPRMPDNIAPADMAKPYENYDAAAMLEFLDDLQPQRPPGEAYEYSNLAVGLLGWLVARQAGSDYQTLLRTRVLQPLGMDDTALQLEPRLAARFAPGHDADAEPVPAWDMGVLEGAGGIRSSVHDMLRFARFVLGDLQPQGSETLGRALALSLIPRREVGDGSPMRIGLGWHVNVEQGIWWHNGQTGGYHAMLEVRPDEGVAVVGLANTANGVIEQLIDRLMVESITAKSATLTLPEQVHLPPEALQRLVGRYGHRLLGVLAVTRLEDRLYAQLATQPAFRVWPSSESSCSYRVVEARLEFAASDGPAPGVVLYQNGGEMSFLRLDDEDRGAAASSAGAGGADGGR